MLNEYLGDEIDILPWSKKGPTRITSGKVKVKILEHFPGFEIICFRS